MKSNLNNDDKYIDMKEFGGNWFFYMDDMKVPDKDIKSIKPLSDEFSSLLWNKNINNHKRHFALFSNYEKMALSLKKIDYNWQDDWNNNYNENFSNYLRENISYNPYDTIIVFWSKECAVETNWEIFLKYWSNFLFDDEGVILINTADERILLFTSDGMMQLGKIPSSNGIL
jgi:hypothetical protein